MDVSTGYGTSIYATTAGNATYKYVTYNSGGTTYYSNYGRYIELISGNRTFRYAHLRNFANGYTTPDYSSMQTLSWDNRTVVGTTAVSQGSVVGYSGNSGNSTDPHLHFEVLISGTNYDPYTYVVFPDIGY